MRAALPTGAEPSPPPRSHPRRFPELLPHPTGEKGPPGRMLPALLSPLLSSSASFLPRPGQPSSCPPQALTLSPVLAGHAPTPRPRPFVLGPALLPGAMMHPPAPIPPRCPPQEPLQASPWDRAATARPLAPEGRLALAAVRGAKRVKPATGEAPPGRPYRGGHTGEASPCSHRQSPVGSQPLQHASGRQRRGPGAVWQPHGRKRGAGRGPCCGGGGTAGAGSSCGGPGPAPRHGCGDGLGAGIVGRGLEMCPQPSGCCCLGVSAPARQRPMG